jgi:hypothetical protein
MMAVGGRMLGRELPEQARPSVQARAVEEDRVVIRCRPYATFATPPRQLQQDAQPQELTHWASSSVRWDAADLA